MPCHSCFCVSSQTPYLLIRAGVAGGGGASCFYGLTSVRMLACLLAHKSHACHPMSHPRDAHTLAMLTASPNWFCITFYGLCIFTNSLRLGSVEGCPLHAGKMMSWYCLLATGASMQLLIHEPHHACTHESAVAPLHNGKVRHLSLCSSGPVEPFW